MSQTKKEDPKPLAKKSVKIESKPKGKEIFFSEEPIVNNNEDDEPDENKLKRRKACEAKMDEYQRIIHEVEVKEKAEREAQVTLESRKLLFPDWTLKQIQNNAADLPSQYWLEPVVTFEVQNT
ncbi:unnamed protein product [Lactuca saligna]|uniref:Uncharacterized protein n=1 Tax=Lactuca saligna TaxID=75948 RepID=A0AA36EB81_LACSI|nr:unnamed protein product [Lactuca saligna]